MRQDLERPLVSVVIPVHDRCDDLACSLESVLAQTYQNLEILVVGDASGHGSADTARKLASRDNRVTVTTAKDPIGKLATYREGLRRAGGTFVKFVLPGDILRPQAIERLFSAFCHADGAVLATSARELIGPGGEILPPSESTVRWAGQDTVVEGRLIGDLVLKKALNLVGELGALFLLRDSIDPERAFSLGRQDFYRLADVALVLRLLVSGFLAYVAEPLCAIRVPGPAAIGNDGNTLLTDLEWLRLNDLAPRISYVDPMLKGEPPGLVSVFSRVANRCLDGPNILAEGLSGALKELTGSVDDLRSRMIQSSQVSLVLPPTTVLDGTLIDSIAAGLGSELELVSVEEAGVAPGFTLPAAMVPVTVVLVESGSADSNSWERGATAALGQHLLFLVESVTALDESTTFLGLSVRAGVAKLERDPLVGIVSLLATEQDDVLLGCVVRAQVFAALGGFPDSGDWGTRFPRGQVLSELVRHLSRMGYEERRIVVGPDPADVAQPMLVPT